MFLKRKARQQGQASNESEVKLNLNATNVDSTNSTTKGNNLPPDNPSGTKLTLLTEAPKVMRRPLIMLDGNAYAATKPYVQIEQHESVDEKGNVQKLNPPKITKERRLAILRDDGKLFYHGQPNFFELGFSVELPELPKVEKLFSNQGIEKYKAGERVNPKILFEQLCEVKDVFIDFNQSIGTQREMCEFISCFILATWFVEAFNVVPFLWINGDKGSGKTQLATLISRLSFIGEMILSSGSFASLRDLADNGACLCFDEAENLSNPKADSFKREIFLAGNRRGCTVTLKKQGKDNNWVNHYVNVFCPRVFSAIERPDSVLASRSIIIPMLRTLDKKKGNADIWESSHWPHDNNKLIDDLWSVALANFSQIPSFDSKAKTISPLVGRAFEPWRAILAIALWLESKGVNGLGARMNKLSIEYQKQRDTIETEDLSSLIIRAICRIINCEVSELGDVCEVIKDSVFIRTADIEAQALTIAHEMELDIDNDEITSRKIGRKLSQQRFEKKREGGTGKFGWKINRKRLYEWALASGLIRRDEGVILN